MLDTHLSGRVIAKALRRRGHDVRAVDEEPTLEGAADDELLLLAADDGRVMVTHNVRDFPDLAQRFAGEGRSHAGLIVLVGISTSEFGLIADRLDHQLAARPTAQDWHNFALFVGRTP